MSQIEDMSGQTGAGIATSRSGRTVNRGPRALPDPCPKCGRSLALIDAARHAVKQAREAEARTERAQQELERAQRGLEEVRLRRLTLPNGSTVLLPARMVGGERLVVDGIEYRLDDDGRGAVQLTDG